MAFSNGQKFTFNISFLEWAFKEYLLYDDVNFH